MKRSLLLFLPMLISISLHSQNSKFTKGFKGVPASIKSKPVKVQPASIALDNEVPFRLRTPFTPIPIETGMHKVTTFNEATIGNTILDNQSNRSMAKRITNNGDGTLSVVWNFIPIIGSSSDRGTGYNYFDGISWGSAPATRIETIRTGFTNIAYTPGGGEFVCAHTASQGVLISHRATKGIGVWDTITVGSYNMLSNQLDLWSRLAVGGINGNTIHVIVNSQGFVATGPVLGQNGPLTYSRSINTGLTWVDDHIQIPGTDSTFMYGVDADTYHIDVRGDVVAVVTGGFTNDVVLFKSVDDGNTWTRTVILPFPLGQPYDPNTMDTDINGDGTGEPIETNAGDVSVSIDNNNICHVACGHTFITQDSGSVIQYFDPFDNTGLLYWHEGMTAPTIIAVAEDFNGNGTIDMPIWGVCSYNVGIIGQPSIGFDVNNFIYIAYSTIDERADTSWGQSYRHVFVIASRNGSIDWTVPYTVNPSPLGDFNEGVYPSIATLVDSCVHIVYQRDPEPCWNYASGPLPLTPSNIIYTCIPSGDLVLGVKTNDIPSNAWVSANYPNPAKDFTTVNVTLNKTSDVTLEITNVIGQLKYVAKKNALATGTHNINIDTSHFDAGIYFYTVTAGEKKVSRKMIVE